MKHGRRIAAALGIGIIILAASCGGGGGNRSLTPGVTTPPPATTDAGEENTAPAVSPCPYTEQPRTVTDTEYVLVKTGDTVEEFAPIAAKFGYEVEYKNGNWLKVRVPDGNIDSAITELRKEYRVFDVQPLREHIMPREQHVNVGSDVKAASYLPFDCLYNDLVQLPTGDVDGEGNPVYGYYFYGQRPYMAPMGFEGAWDVTWRDDIRAVPVTVAVIDAGIWHDPDDASLHPELETSRLNAASARVFGDATPPDTADYFYELDAENNPYRTTGHRLAGLFLSTVNNIINWTMQVGEPPQDAAFLCSMTPVTPFADVMIIKTGHIDGENWAFSDEEVANSINYAVTNGANIILLGMWAPTASIPPVSAIVQDEIDNARATDVLVIAPAGMADLDNSSENIDEWTWGTPGDAAGVTPAAGTGVVSVMATGFEQIDMDHDPPYPPGYVNVTYANIGDAWNEIAQFSYTGGTMAAVGWGLSWWTNFFTYVVYGFMDTNPGEPSVVDVSYAAAYVAGAASIAYQALVNANGGTAPADIDTVIENLLLDEALTLPTGEAFLAAGSLAHVAAEGGYNKIIEPVSVDLVGFSGGVGEFHNFGEYGDLNAAYIETNPDGFQMYAMLSGSDAPFKLRVFWGDGATYPDTGEFTDYNSGDPIDHAYTEPITSVIVFQAQDALENVAQFSVPVVAYNGLDVAPQITLIDGSPVPGDLVLGDVYLMDSVASYPILTGNTVNFQWDFNDHDNGGAFDVDLEGADLTSVIFSYTNAAGVHQPPIHDFPYGPETYTIRCRVVQDLRPTLQFEFGPVTVSGE